MYVWTFHAFLYYIVMCPVQSNVNRGKIVRSLCGMIVMLSYTVICSLSYHFIVPLHKVCVKDVWSMEVLHDWSMRRKEGI